MSKNVIIDDFRFNIYGTSYQWKDEEREWIGKEQAYFVDFLRLYLSKKNGNNNDDKKEFNLHYNMYKDNELNESLIKNNVSKFQKSKHKGLYRHFELLRLFNVNNAKFLL